MAKKKKIPGFLTLRTGGTLPSTWAILIAQVYEVDPLECTRCHSPMKVIAVIIEPEEVRKILQHLVKVGRPPPGLDLVSLN